MLDKTEEATIRNVIARLQCAPRADGSQGESDEVRAALTGPAGLFLGTWVIGALQCLLPESRDTKLARDLSRR